MALCKRGGIYWFNFRFKGRKVQGSTHVTSKTVAREIEAAYRVKLARGEVGIEEKREAPTFKVAIKDFLAWSKAENRPNTYRRYETSSKPLLRYFKDNVLDRITVESVERYRNARSKQKSKKSDERLRPATVNRELACLKALFNKHKYLVNPVEEVKFLNEDNEQMTVLTLAEQEKYLAAASQPLYDIATIMLETGMRPEEVYRIRREHVHLNEGYVYNPYGKTKAAKRKVPLSDAACAVLRARLKGDAVYLFRGRANRKGERDRPIIKVNNAHYSALERSKVRDFRLYDLRHTWASRIAMAGVDLVTLAALLGHSKLAMVTRYAHPTEAHQFEALKKLQAFMTGQLTPRRQGQQSPLTPQA
jgi:integrase